MVKNQEKTSVTATDMNPVKMSSTTSNEQPVSKRQRIDSVETSENTINTFDKLHTTNGYAPPDILPTTTTINRTDVMRIETTRNGFDHTEEIIQQTTWKKGDDDVDNASATNVIICSNNESNALFKLQQEYPDLLQSGLEYEPSTTTDNNLKDALSETSKLTSNNDNNLSDSDEFLAHLSRQCLCGINGRTLYQSLECFGQQEMDDVKHVVELNDWPSDKLILFLSNLQLLCDTYLKQNAKGQICQQLMEMCDTLVSNEHNNVVDEIIQLYEYNNKFVQFLAWKVVASCMVIAKDKRDLYEGWLTTLVANLTADKNNYATLCKINFSLEIILRILEWRDVEEHPLDDTIAIDSRALDIEQDNNGEAFTLPMVVPPIENNYFAMQFNTDYGTSLLSTSSVSAVNTSTNITSQSKSNINRENHENQLQPCQLQHLSDSESFDTTDLKCNVVCGLKAKWPYLVDTMANRTIQLGSSHGNDYTESTILTFLNLWERIISVQANLSIDSTLPFHEKLTIFENMLITGNLPVSIYKQILTLFNESLCYGTTLALQSVLPEETNKLANEIFNSVKSQRIFNSLPKASAEPMNDIGFIGFKRSTIAYSIDRSAMPVIENSTDDFDTSLNGHPSVDNTLIQKLILLILKSIAVTVKPVRGDDSSDSSMDGCSSTSSTEFEAFQATVQIERATRDVLKKLNQFMKNKLDHHPETHFSKIIIHLFADQDDYLIEAMVCMMDITTAFLPRQIFGENDGLRPSRNQFRVLLDMLNPVWSFLEFLELISNNTELLLDLLINNETCFLLYLLRFLKYIRNDWSTFRERCSSWPAADGNNRNNRHGGITIDDDNITTLAIPSLDRAMSVLIRLRMQIERLVLLSQFPYDITPIIKLLHQCESLYEGNDNELF